MKKTICAWVIAICIFLIIGIVGGIDHGQPLTNIIWCLPLAVAMWVSAIIYYRRVYILSLGELNNEGL